MYSNNNRELKLHNGKVNDVMMNDENNNNDNNDKEHVYHNYRKF
jgi:hypothetical protein